MRFVASATVPAGYPYKYDPATRTHGEEA